MTSEATINQPRRVWYRLLDSETGQPYEVTSADKVTVSSNADVADFRDAVKTKNPNKLSSFDASDLLVYKNKDAFDNRNSVEDKDEPLKSSALLNALGTTEDEALIIVVPSLSSISEVNEPIAKKIRLTGRINLLEDLQFRISTPSSFGNHNDNRGWVEFLSQNPNKIICHRVRSEEPSIPVCLLNPTFNQFVHDLNHIDVSSDDCEFVGLLTESMCGSFTSEQERTDAFIALFCQYTKTDFKLKRVMENKCITDGSLSFANGALFCNLQVKVEKCSGHGDPYMQNIAYYIKNLPTAKETMATQYPCFLLELCGPAFSVSGIINTNSQVICDPLSPTFQLFCNQEFVMIQQITKLFASLRRSLTDLHSQGLIGRLPLSSSFPFLKLFSDLNSSVKFEIQYQQRIKGLLFSAKVFDRNEDVIVKFCSRYNQDVHLYCHSCGFAPRLISHSTLGHYFVVVMEKLNLRSLTKNDILKSGIELQIKTIAAQLKQQNYVHGDLRDCNIHLDVVNNKVVLVDFDWSGRHGIDLYPPFMNPAIKWPHGASTGKPLLHEHDDYWLERLSNMN